MKEENWSHTLLIFALLCNTTIGLSPASTQEPSEHSSASRPLRPTPEGEGTGVIQSGAEASAGLAAELTGPLFSVSTIIPGYANFLLAGHFNGDALPDLVATDFSSTLRVFLGNGNGTFALQTYTLGSEASGVATADFNGNAIPDLVVTNDPGRIQILLGSGTGTFTVQPGFVSNSGGMYIAAGDFNADGKQDLAAPIFDDAVLVFAGVGNGAFGSAVSYPVGGFPRGIVAFDFDEDGDEDLITANRSGASDLSLLRGNGDGTFQAMTSISLHSNVGRPSPLLHADFNSDGHEDLAVGGDSTGAVWVLLGNGDGSFQDVVGFRSASSFGSPVNLATADFNGDGRIDLAAPEYFNDLVDVFFGVGNGAFAPAIAQSLPTFSRPEGIAAADWDIDGWDDLAIATQSGIHILINQAPFPGSCQDLDGDGFGFPGDPSCPAGAVEDCDDGNSMISPLASDPCDGVDNNCDLRDGWNKDLDGFTTCAGDCDDTRKNTYPGAREFCNGIDEDCDGVVDVPGENGKDLAFDAAGTTLSWTASTAPNVSYNVYRGSWGTGAFSFAPACFASALTQAQVSATQSPASPAKGFFYVVTGKNSCGEGSMGASSLGNPRPNSLPCP